jgi:hypothetical protein
MFKENPFSQQTLSIYKSNIQSSLIKPRESSGLCSPPPPHKSFLDNVKSKLYEYDYLYGLSLNLRVFDELWINRWMDYFFLCKIYMYLVFVGIWLVSQNEPLELFSDPSQATPLAR